MLSNFTDQEYLGPAKRILQDPNDLANIHDGAWVKEHIDYCRIANSTIEHIMLWYVDEYVLGHPSGVDAKGDFDWSKRLADTVMAY